MSPTVSCRTRYLFICIHSTLIPLISTSHSHGLKRLPKFTHHSPFSLIHAWFEAPTKIRTSPTLYTPSPSDLSLATTGSVLCSPLSEVIASALPGGDALPCVVALFSSGFAHSLPHTFHPCTCTVVGAFVVFTALFYICFSRFRATFSSHRRSRAIFRSRLALFEIFFGFSTSPPSYLVQLTLLSTNMVLLSRIFDPLPPRTPPKGRKIFSLGFFRKPHRRCIFASRV